MDKEEKLTFGQRAADKATNFIGSWKFIIIQATILFCWMTLNIFAWFQHWDPYPYIFLNLIVGFVASFSAPIIMMSQNRTEERDRQKAQQDFEMDKKAERETRAIQEQLGRIEREKLDEILALLKAGK